MRFCDFFISYKIGLKGIKNIIPYTQLPLYRKREYEKISVNKILL